MRMTCKKVVNSSFTTFCYRFRLISLHPCKIRKNLLIKMAAAEGQILLVSRYAREGTHGSLAFAGFVKTILYGVEDIHVF